MRQLDQRISLRALLRPLTRDEVEAYVAHRLAVAARHLVGDVRAGRRSTTVHAYTGGVPRIINLLCDRALILGAQAGVADDRRRPDRRGRADAGAEAPGAGAGTVVDAAAALGSGCRGRARVGRTAGARDALAPPGHRAVPTVAPPARGAIAPAVTPNPIPPKNSPGRRPRRAAGPILDPVEPEP